MELKSITIEGYKSIGKIEIVNPNPFTVFVGANASGKSNIFEALEFLTLCNIFEPFEVPKLFGNPIDILSQQNILKNILDLSFAIDFGGFIKPNLKIGFGYLGDILRPMHATSGYISSTFQHVKDSNPNMLEFTKDSSFTNFFNFTRLLVGIGKVRLPIQDDSRLVSDASNLEKVLKRILKDENKREEIFEILQLLIPGFERVEIVSSELSGTDTLIVYEESLKRPLTKELISDGTYNILAIMAALYQSDEPQFLCIEEPENGINPFVVKELVTIIRNRCKEKEHYVWLNTHSQTLVSQLTKEEMIIVDKINGLTEIKQIKDMELHGLRMDDALYTNSIGGGNPW